MTIDDFHAAVYAKVEGTWNLHKATVELLDEPLAFFTMLSSLVGVVGRRGQSNYAASSSFLDAFASYRQQLGLCANSVDLGMVNDIGYLAEDETGLQSRFNKRHWIPVGESMLRRILSYSILRQDKLAPLGEESGAQLVCGIAYPYPQDGSPTAREPRFRHLYAVQGPSNNEPRRSAVGDDDTAQALVALQSLRNAGSDEGALVRVCVNIVAAQLAKVLRLTGEVEPGKSPMSYGLDSLAAVEFRNWLRQNLGVSLTTLDITNASSILAIGEKAASRLVQGQE